MTGEHIKAALIVYELYGKDVVTEADRKLARMYVLRQVLSRPAGI